jgi:hypothetical protein
MGILPTNSPQSNGNEKHWKNSKIAEDMETLNSASVPLPVSPVQVADQHKEKKRKEKEKREKKEREGEKGEKKKEEKKKKKRRKEDKKPKLDDVDGKAAKISESLDKERKEKKSRNKKDKSVKDDESRETSDRKSKKWKRDVEAESGEDKVENEVQETKGKGRGVDADAIMVPKNDSASPWAATGDSSIPPPSSPPSMIPSAPKCKPSAFLIPTNSSSSCAVSGSIDSGKWPHITGPVAMLGIKDELANLNSTFCMAAESKVKIAKHQLAKLSDSDILDQAQDMLHDKAVGQISNEVLMMMLDLLELDMRKGKTYMRFKDDGLCWMWLKRELQKVNYQEQDVAME